MTAKQQTFYVVKKMNRQSLQQRNNSYFVQVWDLINSHQDHLVFFPTFALSAGKGITKSTILTRDLMNLWFSVNWLMVGSYWKLLDSKKMIPVMICILDV